MWVVVVLLYIEFWSNTSKENFHWSLNRVYLLFLLPLSNICVVYCAQLILQVLTHIHSSAYAHVFSASCISAIWLFNGNQKQEKDGEKRIPIAERKQTRSANEHGLNIRNMSWNLEVQWKKLCLVERDDAGFDNHPKIGRSHLTQRMTCFDENWGVEINTSSQILLL